MASSRPTLQDQMVVDLKQSVANLKLTLSQNAGNPDKTKGTRASAQALVLRINELMPKALSAHRIHQSDMELWSTFKKEWEQQKSGTWTKCLEKIRPLDDRFKQMS